MSSRGTPRRLTLFVNDLTVRQADFDEEAMGPAVKVAYGPDGQPTRALLGFCQGKGVDPARVRRIETAKGEYVAVTVHHAGQPAVAVLPAGHRLAGRDSLRMADLDGERLPVDGELPAGGHQRHPRRRFSKRAALRQPASGSWDLPFDLGGVSGVVGLAAACGANFAANFSSPPASPRRPCRSPRNACARASPRGRARCGSPRARRRGRG